VKEQLGKGGPNLFTPWMALQDQELADEDNRRPVSRAGHQRTVYPCAYRRAAACCDAR